MLTAAAVAVVDTNFISMTSRSEDSLPNLMDGIVHHSASRQDFTEGFIHEMPKLF